MTPKQYLIAPVGIVHKADDALRIEIYEPYKAALLGLEGFSHITVLYWFHQNDTPEQRATLQVHPRKNRDNPLTGVFATHSPVRPNLIAMTPCKILRMDGRNIFIDEIDARDGTPVIDIKPYIPIDKLETSKIRIPAWVSVPKKDHDMNE
jgi:tRNA-Thr(GGU) m(6)t(6)A37 methyltransferase TsaA